MNSLKAPSVTVNDVARSAGVSVGTVSRVLNGAANIAPENLAKVQKAMSDLGYQKHHSAGLLASRKNGSSSRSGNIGLVFADAGPAWSNHPLISAYTMGIEEACRESGFHPLVELASPSGDLPRCVREGKVDGLLVKATRGVPSFVKNLPAHLPVILISVNDPAVNIPQVAPDNQGAGWVVADHLWKKGHRRIAFVCTDSMHPMFITRMHGYESYLRLKGTFDPALVVMESQVENPSVPEETPPDMEAVLDRLLVATRGAEPTAIITANDWMARGLYDAIARRGLKVPQNISVVGFDNVGMLCATMSPTLTSFDLDFSAVVRAAAMDLFDYIEEPGLKRDPSVRLVRGHLVERESVRGLVSIGNDPDGEEAKSSNPELLSVTR
ncbi:MAG: LacI family DNA-binding transcriptional regulator [Opitutaceae bacterium]|jgi:LacI family transcriptional regulator